MIQLPRIKNSPRAFAPLARAFNRAMETLTPVANLTSRDGTVKITASDNNLDLSAPGDGGGGGDGTGYPFAAKLGDDGNLGTIAAGLVLVRRTFAPAITVGEATADAGSTHCWLAVSWNTSYVLSSTATMTFGTAWPSTYDDASARTLNIPIAFVDGGTLHQVTTGNITLLRTLTDEGFSYLPSSL